MRLFIGVKPDGKTAAYLEEKAEEAVKLFDRARMTPRDNYHITLVFIGRSDRKTYMEAVKAVRETAEGTPAFEVEVNGGGSFTRGGKKLCYFSTRMDRTMANMRDTLYSKLNEKGIVDDDRKFLPHMTFARDARTDLELEKVLSVKTSFKVGEVLLMESRMGVNGLEYPAVYRARLRGGK